VCNNGCQWDKGKACLSTTHAGVLHKCTYKHSEGCETPWPTNELDVRQLRKPDPDATNIKQFDAVVRQIDQHHNFRARTLAITAPSRSKARQVTALAERKPLPCSPASPATPAPWLAPSWC
jgi:hypothetical protein